ncbi:MAG: class I SAM-dependent methyltransferase [Chloroflexi bacterium]|nr:class I SAM-dependent methyltransferase [Chloroflexota bacterium]
MAEKREERYTMSHEQRMIELLTRRTAKHNAAFFTPHLRPSMNVLDCGCGPGNISLDLAQIASSGHITGIDMEVSQISMASAEAAKRGITNATFTQANVYELPFADNTFDAVFTHTLVSHLAEPAKGISEMRRVLKPGGILGIRDLQFSNNIVGPRDHPMIGEGARLFAELMRANGGDPDVGHKLPSIVSTVGFTLLSATSSSDVFALPDDIDWFGQWINSFFALAPIAGRMMELGLTTAEHIEEIQDAALEWGVAPGAFFAMCFVEVVGKK